jgi:drug/metabolite transporter (DMT)-like permease
VPHSDPDWRLRVAIAFATVYFVWGSTYLAIRVGVLRLPPLLFAGTRFLAAGLLLAAYARLAHQRLPRSAREWRTVAVAAVFLLVGANGLVVWGEQWVPSNQAALLAAATALWLAGLGTLGTDGERLSVQRLIGLVTGFVGVAILVWPRRGFSIEHLGAQLAILAAGLSWAAGSIYIKRAKPVTPPLMSAAMQSLVAGALLTGAGLADGEAARWVWDRQALLALAYLVVFGSCLAYAAYVWLLHEVSPAALGTYAYVNPVVAVILGALILNESFSGAQFLGMLVVLFGVVLVSLPPAAHRRPRSKT